MSEVVYPKPPKVTRVGTFQAIQKLAADVQGISAEIEKVWNEFGRMVTFLNQNPLKQLDDTTILLGALIYTLEKKELISADEIKAVMQVQAMANVARRQQEMVQGAVKEAKEAVAIKEAESERQGGCGTPECAEHGPDAADVGGGPD